MLVVCILVFPFAVLEELMKMNNELDKGSNEKVNST